MAGEHVKQQYVLRSGYNGINYSIFLFIMFSIHKDLLSIQYAFSQPLENKAGKPIYQNYFIYYL